MAFDWKEFLKPSWKKVLLFLVVLLLMSAAYIITFFILYPQNAACNTHTVYLVYPMFPCNWTASAFNVVSTWLTLFVTLLVLPFLSSANGSFDILGYILILYAAAYLIACAAASIIFRKPKPKAR